MRLLFSFLIILFGLIPITNAKDSDCFRILSDIQIEACSKIIKTRRFSGKRLANVNLAHFYFVRGQAYFRQKQFYKAIADFNEAIRLKPKSASAYERRGYTYYKLGETQKGLLDAEKAQELLPDNLLVLSTRGKIYAALGRHEEAVKDLKKAARLAPKNKEFRAKLDKILASIVAKAEENKKQKVISSPPKRFALLIGNDSYSNLKDYQQLKKAKNDAQSLADTFEKIGYKTTLGLDLGRSAINKTLDKFADQINPGDEVVFFFAGHGVRIKGRNYLLPSDIPDMSKSSEDYLTTEAIPADRITDIIKNKGARVAMLILDACRNNPFTNNLGRSIGGKRGLAIMTPPEGTFVLFSAGAGQEALDRLSDDDAHPNSVFTRTLIPLLQEDELEIGRLARVVRQKVKKLAETVNHKQTPAVYNEITGDFYLAKK